MIVNRKTVLKRGIYKKERLIENERIMQEKNNKKSYERIISEGKIQELNK